MSDRTTVDDRDDLIARRLVSALDALPVPAGPAHLRTNVARRPQDQRLLVFAAVVLMVLVAFSVEPIRDAASQATHWIQRALFGPPWSAYYNETDPASGLLHTQRLRLAAGDFPGIETRPTMLRMQIAAGPWSADGTLNAIVDFTTKIYVGDRLGNVREVVDLGTEDHVYTPAAWIGPRRLFTVSRRQSGAFWAVTIDVDTGAVDRRRLETPIVRRDDPLGDPFVGVPAFVSPDGRWLAFGLGPGGCGEPEALYEIATHRVVDVADPQGRPAYAAGWLPDGRLVSAYCDRSAARVDVFVSAPGARPDRPIATLPLSASVPVFAFDHVSDHFLVYAETPTEERTATILDPTGRVIRSVRIPQLTAHGAFGELTALYGLMTLSRDGKFLSFRILERPGDVQTARVGVVELNTGQLTYACDVDCRRLVLR